MNTEKALSKFNSQLIEFGIDLDAVQLGYERAYKSLGLMNRLERLIAFKLLLENETFVFHDLKCNTEQERFISELLDSESLSEILFKIE